jgi:hypothetical protein
LTEWAESEADVRLADGAPAVRSRLVERLELEAWLPSPGLQYAFETLAIGPERLRGMPIDPTAGDYFVAAEGMLRDEIETFAGEYFQIEPAARAQRWRSLAERAVDFPALASRMRQLRTGLDVSPQTPDAEPILKSLAEHVVELYTLPPHERAKRRRFPSERFQEFVTRWPAAAARLRQQYPKLAALEPQLIEQLTCAKQLSTRGYAAPGVRPVNRPASRISETALHETDPEERPRSRRGGFSLNLGSWGSGLVVVIIFKMLVLFSKSCDGPSSYRSGSSGYGSGNSNYSTTSGYYNTRQDLVGPGRLTEDDQRRIQDVIEKLKARRSESPGIPGPPKPFGLSPPSSPGSADSGPPR